MSINDWQAGLQAFLDSNPDLPQGEEAKEECVVDKKKSQPLECTVNCYICIATLPGECDHGITF